MKKKILIRGPVLSRSGYGEMARLALRSLMSQPDKYDIYLQATGWGNSSWLTKRDKERETIDKLITKSVQYFNHASNIDATLQITIPNEWDSRMCPINIGYTAGIETDNVSPEWVAKANSMNGVIVISDHSKQAFSNTKITMENSLTGEKKEGVGLEVPIKTVGMLPKFVEPEEISGVKFDYPFNFLCVAQWNPRKNIEKTIEWWIEEFIDQKVGLVLKTSIAGNCIIDKEKVEQRLESVLSSYPDRKCKVYLLHGDLEDGHMNWLYQHDNIKCLINLSHGEGLGLPMLEAANNALPVMTIDWSGQTDFLINGGKKYFSDVKYELNEIQPDAVWPGVLEEGTKWAFADQGSFKMKLRDMKKNWKKHKKNATTLKGIVNKNYTEEKIHHSFCNAVSNILEKSFKL